MAFITGKANIIGGNIYSSQFCPLNIGKNLDTTINNNTRVHEIYTKHLDLIGELKITDCQDNVRIQLDNNNILQFNNQTNFDEINACNIIITDSLTLSNTTTNIVLQDDKQLIASRTNDLETNYMFDLTSTNALQVTGKCNIIGDLYLNSISIDDAIDTKIDSKFNNLNIIELTPVNDIAGLFINNSGLIWKNNKFNLLKNISYENNEITNNNQTDEYDDICLGTIESTQVTTNDIISNNMYEKLYEYNLSNINDNIITVEISTHSISKFSNGNGSTRSISLSDPSSDLINNSYAIKHHIITDHTFNGVLEIDGSFIFPDGLNENKKLSLSNKGESIILTFIDGYWYINNAGGEVI